MTTPRPLRQPRHLRIRRGADWPRASRWLAPRATCGTTTSGLKSPPSPAFPSAAASPPAASSATPPPPHAARASASSPCWMTAWKPSAGTCTLQIRRAIVRRGVLSIESSGHQLGLVYSLCRMAMRHWAFPVRCPRSESRMRFGAIDKDDRGDYITVLEGDLYPDILEPARIIYTPVMERFGALLGTAASAVDLYRKIMGEPNLTRNKLVAVFRRYFTDVSTENLGKVTRSEHVIRHFGKHFRAIAEVRSLIANRLFPDETLMAILYLNSQRGKTGYRLTGIFFEWFAANFSDRYAISGPKGSGKDLDLSKELDSYSKPTKADFLIRDESRRPLVVGFARYDAHRGGSQEDDRIKGNNDNITDIKAYADEIGRPIRILFLNDGPGLDAGSMWNDYAALEDRWIPNVIVSTLKMLDARVTSEWIDGL